MGNIIDRALDIINDHLKDQTSSFSDPVSLKPMARGGHVLEDDYPSHYLPGVGRQVMADGGAPIKGFEGRVSSPVPVDEPVAAEGVEAYHGSPHEFEEFDPSKIGTGEGAQVYGHGLYFAGNENIAKYYRDSLTDPDNVSLHFKGRPVDTVWNDEISDRWGDVVKKLPKDHEEDFQTVMGNLSQIKNLSELKHIRASLDRKQNNILDKVILPELSKPEVGSGHMYEVRLDAHPEEHLLDWDKPLKDQHPNVIAAFNKAVVPIKDDEDKMIHEMYGDKAAHEYLGLFDKSKGSQAYKTFAEHLGGQDKASEALSKAGIRGIRYLDAGSRGQDEKSGSHNYVIFDPQHIKVKRRYAEGGEVPKSDDEGIVAYAFGNSVPHIEQRIAAGDFPEISKAYGGAIYTPELTGDPDDLARRLILWSYAAAPIARPLSRAEGGSTYPVAMPTEIKEDLKDGKAKMRHLSPQEFLDEADPLHIGKGDRHIIDSFEHHIKHGHKLGPLKLYEGGHQDGRHRANAAKDLGVKKVPVIDYRKAAGGSVDDAQNAVDVAKNVSPVENDLLQPIGKSKMVGNEKPLFDEGKYKAGMASYGWNNKRSIRYLHHDDDGNPIGALQIMTQGPRTKKAVIQNVYVSENNRRNKIASGLLKRARQDYDVRHSDDLTYEGRAFAKAVKANGGPVDDAQNAVDVARNLTPMGFYSAAAEAASKFPQKAPIDQIISKIKGQPNVKTAELDNANLKDAFAGQRSVDPQEVARHLQANVPQIEETVYGGKPTVKYKPKALLERPKGFENTDDVYEVGPQGKPPHLIAVNGDNFDVWGPSGYHNSFDSFNDAVEYANQSIHDIGPTKYGEYTLPGGENYREVVMTLPWKRPHNAEVSQNKHGEWQIIDPLSNNRHILNATNYEDALQEGEERLRSVAPGSYRSSHWSGVTNPIAHLRMSDRDNGKTLHLEELQSDWGQEAQKIRKQEIKKIIKEKGIDKKEASKLVPSDFGFKDPNENRADSLLDQMIQDFSFKLPRAPYVTDTGQWVDLGLKRALMEAAKGGYDKLIWTPGEEQANRYNLRKHVEALSYDPEDKVLSFLPHGGNRGRGYINIPGKIEPHEIEEHIGKEAAERLLAAEPNKLSGNHNLSGEDLEVGGEGMQAFYDKLVPQRLNKLVAQYDPEAKVQLHSHKVTIPGETGQKLTALRTIDPTNSSGYEDKDMMVHAIQITPKLRAAILKGLPAFRSGGDVGKSPIIDRAFKVLSKLSR